ncbi:serine/threonine protein kinase, CMGC group [Chytridiales sp. JEL 0842]|nr:serine/threonine protein kinase, CMGC group [Chytridiales sp. JEL 0842]
MTVINDKSNESEGEVSDVSDETQFSEEEEDVEDYRKVALKIVKSDKHYTETALDEIKLLDKVVTANPNSHQRKYVVELYDWFKHKGPHGTHISMGFEVLGPNLLTLIRQYHHRGIPLPIVKRIMKQVLMGLDYLHRDCEIIHTDLKPENVLICINVPATMRKLGIDGVTAKKPVKSNDKEKKKPSGNPQSSAQSSQANTTEAQLTRAQKKKKRQKAKKAAAKAAAAASGIPQVVTSNSASFAEDSNADDQEKTRGDSRMEEDSELTESKEPRLQPASSIPLKEDLAKLENPERAEKNHTKTKADDPERKRKKRQERRDKRRMQDEKIRVKIADLGNACWVQHHFTSDIQTRQYRSPEAILGAKYDCSADLWSVGCMTFELLTGDYLFDPQAGSRYSKDDDHVAQIIELLGGFPKHIATTGKYASEIFNRKGELRRIHKLRYWKLPEVLMEKYHFSKEDANSISEFILPMIEINPEKRATAAEMLTNPWIADVEISESEEPVHIHEGIGPRSSKESSDEEWGDYEDDHDDYDGHEDNYDSEMDVAEDDSASEDGDD